MSHLPSYLYMVGIKDWSQLVMALLSGPGGSPEYAGGPQSIEARGGGMGVAAGQGTLAMLAYGLLRHSSGAT